MSLTLVFIAVTVSTHLVLANLTVASMVGRLSSARDRVTSTGNERCHM